MEKDITKPIMFEVGKMYRNPKTNEEICVLAEATMMLFGDVFIVESNKASDVKSMSKEPVTGWYEIDQEEWERNFFGDLSVYDKEPTTATDRDPSKRQF